MNDTMQKIFNHVWDYFLTDKNDFGWNAAGGMCEYRTPSGAKCAIGCMIPDEYYDKGMEGESACSMFGNSNTDYDLTGCIEDQFGSTKGLDTAFFARLQHVHDHAAEQFTDAGCVQVRTAFREYMTNIANDAGLKTP